jgi:hypothetical protein
MLLAATYLRFVVHRANPQPSLVQQAAIWIFLTTSSILDRLRHSSFDCAYGSQCSGMDQSERKGTSQAVANLRMLPAALVWVLVLIFVGWAEVGTVR